MNKEVFVARLKDARERKDLTLKELAEKCNVSLSAINRYVAMTSMPTIEVAASIAEALDVSLDWLCGLKQKENDPGEMSTGKLVRMLSQLLITETYTAKNDSPEYAANFAYWGNSPVYIEISERNIPNIMDFAAWDKFMSLYRDGTIDREMYEGWIEKKAEQLDSIALPVYTHNNSTTAEPSEIPN